MRLSISMAHPFHTVTGFNGVNVYLVWFCGVVVITSALHAEGREFEPRQNLSFSWFLKDYTRPVIDFGLAWMFVFAQSLSLDRALPCSTVKRYVTCYSHEE